MIPAAELVSTLRYVGKITSTAASGSAQVPAGWTAATGVYLCFTAGTGTLTGMPVSISGNTITWSNNKEGSTFQVLFFLNRQTSVPTGWGLWIRNGSNIVVLDSNYKVAVIQSRGTASLPIAIGQVGYMSNIISVPEGSFLCVEIAVGDTVCAGDIGFYGGQNRILSKTRQSIPYVCVTFEATMPDSAWGLQLFNSAGVRVFDQAVEVVDVVQGGTISCGDAKPGFSIPSRVNYVSVHCPALVFGPGEGQVRTTDRVGFRRNTSTQAQLGYNPYGSLPPSNTPVTLPADNVPYSYLLLDI